MSLDGGKFVLNNYRSLPGDNTKRREEACVGICGNAFRPTANCISPNEQRASACRCCCLYITIKPLHAELKCDLLRNPRFSCRYTTSKTAWEDKTTTPRTTRNDPSFHKYGGGSRTGRSPWPRWAAGSRTGAWGTLGQGC